MANSGKLSRLFKAKYSPMGVYLLTILRISSAFLAQPFRLCSSTISLKLNETFLFAYHIKWYHYFSFMPQAYVIDASYQMRGFLEIAPTIVCIVCYTICFTLALSKAVSSGFGFLLKRFNHWLPELKVGADFELFSAFLWSDCCVYWLACKLFS